MCVNVSATLSFVCRYQVCAYALRSMCANVVENMKSSRWPTNSVLIPWPGRAKEPAAVCASHSHTLTRLRGHDPLSFSLALALQGVMCATESKPPSFAFNKWLLLADWYRNCPLLESYLKRRHFLMFLARVGSTIHPHMHTRNHQGREGVMESWRGECTSKANLSLSLSLFRFQLHTTECQVTE